MTNEQIAAFYREIADVCAKHEIGCFTGIWFSGAGHEEHGVINIYNVADTDMQMMGCVLALKMDEWKEGVCKTKKIGKIHGVTDKQDEKTDI